MPGKGIPKGAVPRKVRQQKTAEYFQEGLARYRSAATKGDFAAAADAFGAALDWTADNPRLYFARCERAHASPTVAAPSPDVPAVSANCRRILQQYQDAISDYGRAIELEPKTAVFYANRGVCMRKVRARPAACGRLRRT